MINKEPPKKHNLINSVKKEFDENIERKNMKVKTRNNKHFFNILFNSLIFFPILRNKI